MMVLMSLVLVNDRQDACAKKMHALFFLYHLSIHGAPCICLEAVGLSTRAGFVVGQTTSDEWPEVAMNDMLDTAPPSNAASIQRYNNFTLISTQ